jgi:hypothetical protein
MDSKSLEGRLSVFLRVTGDEAMSQYERSIEVIDRSTVRLCEAAGRPGAAFMKKDRVENSPRFLFSNPLSSLEPGSPAHRRMVTAFSSAKRSKSTPSSKGKKEDIYDFDYVFTENDPPESLLGHFLDNFSQSLCLVSVGKSNVLQEVLPGILAKAYREGWRVKLQVSTVSEQKLVNFLGSEDAEFPSFDTAMEALRNSEGRRTGESVAVVTMRLEQDQESRVVQVVDVPVFNKPAGLLFRVIANSDSPKDAGAIDSDKLLKLVKKSLSASAVVKVLGNVCPTGPHYASASYLLKMMEHLMHRKHRCETLQAKILSDQVSQLKRTLQMAHDEIEAQRRINHEAQGRHAEQTRALEQDLGQLRCELVEARQEKGSSSKEAFYQESLTLRDAEIIDLRMRLQSQRSEVPSSELFEKQLAAKDRHILYLEGHLEAQRAAYEQSVQALPPPKQLSVTTVVGVTVLGERSDRELLAEMLRTSWTFTNTIVTQMKESLQQEQLISMSKASRLKARATWSEVELNSYKQAYLEVADRLEIVAREKYAVEQELEALTDLFNRCKVKVQTDMKTMKDNGEAKIKDKSRLLRQTTKENVQLRSQVSDSTRLTEQIAELQAQVENWQFTATRYKEESSAAAVDVKRLEEQVTQLRELRRPLRH